MNKIKLYPKVDGKLWLGLSICFANVAAVSCVTVASHFIRNAGQQEIKNLAKNNRQHGKVDMLKAARSTVAEPVSGNLPTF